MTDKKKFIIGSRGSKLSLAYSSHVKNLLIKFNVVNNVNDEGFINSLRFHRYNGRKFININFKFDFFICKSKLVSVLLTKCFIK